MNEELSAEEAANRIDSSIDALGESMRTLENGGLSTDVKAFLGLDNGTPTSEEWVEQLLSGIDAVFESSNERFLFDASIGEHVWTPNTNEWEEEEAAGSVILRFPASEGATGNNATFELSQYSDTPVTADEETVYLPTSGTASIAVEGTEVFAVNLSEAAYTTEDGLDIPLPQSFTLEILTAPHTHTFVLSENSSTDYEFSFSLANGDDLVAGISIQASLGTDNYDVLELNDVEELSGAVRISGDLTIPYTIAVGELVAFDNPTEEQINNRVDATIEYQGQQIATLRYDKSAEQVEIVYSDGSVDAASDFYENFLGEMETAWSDYLGFVLEAGCVVPSLCT